MHCYCLTASCPDETCFLSLQSFCTQVLRVCKRETAIALSTGCLLPGAACRFTVQLEGVATLLFQPVGIAARMLTHVAASGRSTATRDQCDGKSHGPGSSLSRRGRSLSWDAFGFYAATAQTASSHHREVSADKCILMVLLQVPFVLNSAFSQERPTGLSIYSAAQGQGATTSLRY